MPDDPTALRDSPVGVHGRSADGYTSYFMESRTIPSFDSTLHSGIDKLYWRTAANNTEDNVDIHGVTVDECFEICHITTDGLCFVFRCAILSGTKQETTPYNIHTNHFVSN